MSLASNLDPCRGNGALLDLEILRWQLTQEGTARSSVQACAPGANRSTIRCCTPYRRRSLSQDAQVSKSGLSQLQGLVMESRVKDEITRAHLPP